jgi:patatin-like phospholipase/acyl hydrolase
MQFCAHSNKLLRALAIDGGGVFGIIPATQLANKDVFNDFDIYGGTSIGAACAAWYAMGEDPKKLPENMRKALPKIFSRNIFQKLNPWGPKWPKDELTEWCKDTFCLKMKHLNKHLFIVSMDYANRRPKVFDSHSPEDADIYVWEAVLASVSAPTYFAPHGNLVDGGIFANTPSVVTAAGIARRYDVEMDDIAILSVGTGSFNRPPMDMKKAGSWNILGWATTLIPVMMEGVTETGMSFIASQLPLAVYYRSNLVVLDRAWNMDNPSIIGMCVTRAENELGSFDKCYKSFKDDCIAWTPSS